MAQNTCQQMVLSDFYVRINKKAHGIHSMYQLMQAMSEFLNTMDAATATNMGMDTTTRDDVADLRTAVNEAIDFYDGTATSRTKILKTQINKLRQLV